MHWNSALRFSANDIAASSSWFPEPLCATAEPPLSMILLRGIGWDHERCLGPLIAGSQEWERLGRARIEWEARSLRDFGDRPLEDLALSFDLLTIDYPFVGTAYQSGCLTPLDVLLSSETLAALSEDAVGPSHESYRYRGHQWALATDAACQVSAIRDDLVTGFPVPETWEQAVALAQHDPGRVALPLLPADAVSSFLTICANAGAPACDVDRFVAPEAGARALELLQEFASLGPRQALDLDPPRMLDWMTSTDEIVYMPLAYGYTNYSRPGQTKHPCRFLDIPSSGFGPIGATLGGAGLAVSASSEHQFEAAAFASWITGADAQRTTVFDAGGQPGSSSAWRSSHVARASGGFTTGTIRTMEASYVRPHEPWWPGFQLAAGESINHFLREGGTIRTELAELETLYEQARRNPGAV
jgi:multiple sugar transport system substrate-binding protein